MPVCGLPSLLVRTRQKIHSPYWASVVQVFWPLTMYLSPLRSARRLERGQVGAGARFAVALAPPHFAAGDAGQEALLLLGVAEGHDHRRHHHRAERHHARRAGQRAFFLEQVLLHRVPARAAELLGPAVAQPALLAQDAGPALHVVARQAQRVVDLVRNFGRQVGAHPGAHVFAELLFFRGKCQIHEGVSNSAPLSARSFYSRVSGLRHAELLAEVLHSGTKRGNFVFQGLDARLEMRAAPVPASRRRAASPISTGPHSR